MSYDGRAAALSLGAVGDPDASRLVYTIVVALVVIGMLFVILGIWVIRQTRVDPEMLAPLERMGDRDWRRLDPASQRRILDEARPVGAEPLQPEVLKPEVDAEFELSDRPVQSFDDLQASGLEAGVGESAESEREQSVDEVGSGDATPPGGLTGNTPTPDDAVAEKEPAAEKSAEQ